MGMVGGWRQMGIGGDGYNIILVPNPPPSLGKIYPHPHLGLQSNRYRWVRGSQLDPSHCHPFYQTRPQFGWVKTAKGYEGR